MTRINWSSFSWIAPRHSTHAQGGEFVESVAPRRPKKRRAISTTKVFGQERTSGSISHKNPRRDVGCRLDRVRAGVSDPPALRTKADCQLIPRRPRLAAIAPPNMWTSLWVKPVRDERSGRDRYVMTELPKITPRRP